jgi:serine/threonine-protein kinase
MRLALFLLLICPALSHAADYFGAIAFSNRTKAHGWAKDFPSRAAAEKAAIASCAKHADDCQAVLWFKNACGALATGPKGSGWAWAEDQLHADNAARHACEQHSPACTVKRRVCTTK